MNFGSVKKALALVMAFVTLCLCSAGVSAAAVDENNEEYVEEYEYIVEPYSAIINSCNAYISIENRQIATCTGRTSCSSDVYKIEITVTLQKKGAIFWNDVTYWTETVYSNSAELKRGCAVEVGETYRTKVKVVAYYGSKSTKQTNTSGSYAN